MRFKVLGPLEIEGDDGSVPIVGQRLRALLTALLTRPNEVVATARLIEAIWGEDPPDAPVNALQQVVTRLRSRLGRAAGCVATAPGGYRVVVAPGALDADLFETSCRRARRLMEVEPEVAARELESALALWRGPAYGEFADGFAQAASVRLAELRTAAAEDHLELLIRTGAATDAVAGARHLVGETPLRERPVELLMRALHACGRVADALEAYRSHRQLLADELGLDPPAGLRDLEARILQDDLPGPARAELYRGAAPLPVRVALPGRPGTIIGREDDLVIVRRCLATRPLVSLVGPGGVGKTRLALELAHELALEDRPVVWVDLSTVERCRIADLVADATGVDMPRGQDPHALLGVSLRASSAVLCLDNAETVLDEAASLVETLLDHAPRLRILVTSRERLAVHSEHVHRLAPLPLPTNPDSANPAIRLFLARASGLPEPPTEAALADIALLCRRLDGLPLAIELGAAQAPTFGIRQFTDHIAGELDLLAGGRRTAATRHRTLRAVVDASYGLLTPDEALLFSRLAVFPGAFGLAEARTVCADDRLAVQAVGPLLARLAEQSLVQTDDGRFWLLETLRTYALERLGDGDLLDLRSRHASAVVDRVTDLRWQQQPDTEASCVAQLAAMTSDLHAAWAYSVQLDRALAVELAAAIYDFAYHRQRLDLLDWGRHVAQWEDIDHPELSQALATGAAGAWAAGDLEAAEAIAVRGIASDDGTTRPRRARSVSQAGNLAMFAGRFDEAIRRFEECVSANLEEHRPVAALVAEVAVCQAMTYAGGSAEARERLPRLLGRARAMGNPSAIAWASYVTGEATAEVHVPGALAAYRTAVEESLKVDNRLFLGLARSSAVALAARDGSAQDALAEFERVMDDWDELGNVTAQWWVLLNVSTLLARLGQDRPAALLAGALLGTEERTYMLLGDEARLRGATQQVTARLGEEEARATLAEGRALSIDEAVTLARHAIRSAAGPAHS
jgi:predicted ATPase/DNA-binding SARP family transcriptional activator